MESITGGYETADLKVAEVKGFYLAAAKTYQCNAGPNCLYLQCHQFICPCAFLYSIRKRRYHRDCQRGLYFQSNCFLVTSEKVLALPSYRAASKPEGGVDIADMKTLIELHQPKLVSLTHIPSNTGLVQPVEAVGEICKALDILYLVDACQSAGQWPIDVPKSSAIFYR